MKNQYTVIALLGLLYIPTIPALSQNTNQITAVSPNTAAQGTTNLLVTFTLDTDSPPAPPAGVVPDSVQIGSISGTSVTHASQHTVTAQFSIPAGESTGARDATVTFTTPNGQLVFSKSEAFTVTSGAATPPTITQHPQPCRTAPGGSATFTVSASGADPLFYQWQKDSADISGANAASLTIDPASEGDAGSYRCVVSNDYGTATSDEAVLTVSELPRNKYPIVDTNQTRCYDSINQITAPSAGEPFHGQDAQYSGNQPSYTLGTDGLTVHDNVTGLTWQRSPDTNGDGSITISDKLTLSEAQARPAVLNSANYGGYSDWRLPTIKELYSLILFSGTDPGSLVGDDTSLLIPFIDTDYFDFAYGDPNTGDRIIDVQYVSGTVYVGNTNLVFGVNFADGRIKGYGMVNPSGEKTFCVICVRGNTDYGVNNFVDNGDGTVTDLATGLMWQKADSGSGLNWEQALSYAENLELAGHSDWRLPNAKELQSIVDYTRSPDTTASAAIDPIFNCTQITNEANQTDYPWYWSGTTHAAHTGTGGYGAYVAFGRALGYMNGSWVDIHGAGCQRSDPKGGSLSNYTYAPYGYYHYNAPQGDAIRIYNYVRCVRDVTTTSVTTPSEAKQLPDGAQVSISGQIVTTDPSESGGYFYIEDPDRASGIRVETPGTVTGLERGSEIWVVGSMSTTGAGERQISEAAVSVLGYHGELSPLGMNCSTFGSAFGVSTTGLLVRVWGEVTTVGTGYIEISDGGMPARIDTSNLTTSYSIGDFIEVTGISSLYQSDTDCVPLLLP